MCGGNLSGFLSNNLHSMMHSILSISDDDDRWPSLSVIAGLLLNEQSEFILINLSIIFFTGIPELVRFMHGIK